MNLASGRSYFCTYLHAIQCWSENFLLWMGEAGEGAGGEIRTCIPRVVYETLKWWKLLNSLLGPNYMMIRRAIFGKVHGRGVKEIWLISQFPAKHKGVASGPKIVFARPGLARLLGYGYGVTVEPRSTDTPLIRTPRYYGQFGIPRPKAHTFL